MIKIKRKKIELGFVLRLSLLLLFLTTPLYSVVKENLVFIYSSERVLPYKYIHQLFPFSLRHQVELVYLQNWILTESRGNPKAYNRYTKDYGLCQLHDVDYLVDLYWDEKSLGPFDVWNGTHNLTVALCYLDDLITEFGIEYGFMAYNIGPNRIRRGRILKSGKAYVSKIFDIKEVEEKPSFKLFREFPLLSFSSSNIILFDNRKKKLIEEIGQWLIIIF